MLYWGTLTKSDAQTSEQKASHLGGLMARLTKLGEMKQAALLSDEEFATAKLKLLG